MAKKKVTRSGEPTGGVTRAHLLVDARKRAREPLTPYLTGKFCEHLGSNIYNGMHAQVLRNPTFAEHLFGAAGRRPDGGARFQCDEERIEEQVKHFAERWALPDGGLEQLLEARADGLAFPWVWEGSRKRVPASPMRAPGRGGWSRVSPDVGPAGGRAQRVEASAAGEGVSQWTHLPLHRVRGYEFRLVARSTDLTSLTVTLSAEGGRGAKAQARVKGLSRTWGAFTGKLVLSRSAPVDALYRLSVTAPRKGQFVLGRVLLYPADHVHGNDPDVIRFLRDSKLPILRWPGGNFVSGYHWEDGVGPADFRPTRANPAWSGVEPNLFGTDEFITFCRDVGCEPLICLNAGDGTPEEAARWVEYCNGSPRTKMGALRAANGHRKPFGVRYWEIGNELSGRHQINWTTPAGYADRYRKFAEAMLAVDPSLKLIACGEPPWLRRGWNEALIAADADNLRSICDHILVGGRTDPATDPLGVFQDFMVFPAYCEMLYTELAGKMRAAGIREPRVAVTELQLFATLSPPKGKGRARLTRETMVSPDTLAEALYDVLVCHGAVRLAPVLEMVTQSATVNHGGGLRKEWERVYANPCHYGQKMFACFNGATPVTVALRCAREKLPRVMPDSVRAKVPMKELPVLDTVAAIGRDGALLISVVHRGLKGPVELTIGVDGARLTGRAQVETLAADVPWARNRLTEPEAVMPRTSTAEVTGGALTLTVPRYSLTVIRIPAS